MKIDYHQEENRTSIYFAESLALAIKKETVSKKQVIILTNQRYYDLFYDKIHGLFSPGHPDWYICSNSLYGNRMEELISLLQFLSKFPVNQPYLFVALGNESVIHLSGVIQKVSILDGDFWSIPVSLRAYTAALIEEHFILKNPTTRLLQATTLPQAIFLDHTIIDGQNQGKFVDFLVLLVASFVCDASFLKKIYTNYPTRKQIEVSSYADFIQELTRFYEQSANEIESFGKVFEEAFYLVENGHLLSSSMKRILGVVLHLCWNQLFFEKSFHFEKFLRWLDRLGFPLHYPEEISISEYCEAVLVLQNKHSRVVVLSEIGTIGTARSFQAAELIRALEMYQDLQNKI